MFARARRELRTVTSRYRVRQDYRSKQHAREARAAAAAFELRWAGSGRACRHARGKCDREFSGSSHGRPLRALERAPVAKDVSSGRTLLLGGRRYSHVMRRTSARWCCLRGASRGLVRCRQVTDLTRKGCVAFRWTQPFYCRPGRLARAQCGACWPAASPMVFRARRGSARSHTSHPRASHDGL